MEEKSYLLAYIDDKITLANKKNKILNTVFYTENEIEMIQKYLKAKKETRFFWSGGFEEAQRKVLIVYPEKFTQEIAYKNIDNILKAIWIKLPHELRGAYEHRDYLSTFMKLGLERERFGDIIVFEEAAYVIVLNENAEYISENLKHFTRFKKSQIEIVSIQDVKTKPITFEELRIVVTSERIDNFVSEIIKCSRSQSEEFLITERVFINRKLETKPSKVVKVGDIVTIRGKGKYIIDSYVGENKKGRKVYLIKKYIS